MFEWLLSIFIAFIRAPPTNVGGALLFSACLSICLSVRNFLTRFHPNLVYGLLPSKSHSRSTTGFVRRTINQNSHRLSICTCRHSTLVIYYRIASKFHIWVTFIKLSPKFEYGLFPTFVGVRLFQFSAKITPNMVISLV